MPRVLVSDKLESGGLDLLREGGIELDNRPGLSGSELQSALQAADGLIVRSATRVTAELLENPGRLRAIARAGVGVDNIDVGAATRKGIVVMNTPGGNTVSTAEHTIALLCALARHIPAAHESTRLAKWEKSRFTGTQLTGKTIGIIGLGRVGREVASRAAGLELHVLAFDPMVAADRADQLGVASVSSLEQLLPRCDFLTVHTPLTDETRGMIGARELAMLRPGARVINCARGGIIDENDLVEALQSGRLAGAALDVFVKEPPGDHPLFKLPNVIVTPHLAASTAEAQESVAREAAQLLIDFLSRGLVQFAVNLAAVDRSEMDDMRLDVDLARRLGLLHAQMSQGTIRRATLTYKGDVVKRGTRLLNAAFAAGLLEARLAEHVNIVNAEVLAGERGIEISERTSAKKSDFRSLIVADLETEKKTYTAAATIFGNQYPRLIQLGPYRLDTFLDGIMLILTHQDAPGLVGQIGTIFGAHGVNIAQMTVGREQPGGEAIAVLNLDSMPPEPALSQIRANPQVHSLSVAKLPPAGQMPDWFG
jgi:D-3-phosphoglycerate dehydrogenase